MPSSPKSSFLSPSGFHRAHALQVTANTRQTETSGIQCIDFARVKNRHIWEVSHMPLVNEKLLTCWAIKLRFSPHGIFGPHALRRTSSKLDIQPSSSNKHNLATPRRISRRLLCIAGDTHLFPYIFIGVMRNQTRIWFPRINENTP